MWLLILDFCALNIEEACSSKTALALQKTWMFKEMHLHHHYFRIHDYAGPRKQGGTGIEWNLSAQLLVCADDIHLVSVNINTTNRNMQALSDVSDDCRLEVKQRKPCTVHFTYSVQDKTVLLRHNVGQG
jgi:hypothetical protein